MGTNVPIDTPGFSTLSRPLSVMATPFLFVISLHGIRSGPLSLIGDSCNATVFDIRLFADLRLQTRGRRREDATSTFLIT